MSGTQSLGVRAARGAAVVLAGQGIRIVIQVVSVVVLARLLTPHDYGLIAMVAAVIGIATILRDFGLSSAAIQSPTLSRVQRDNLVWINGGIGAALGVMVFFSAWPIAAFFDEPALVAITQALSPTFLLGGLATQYRADLNRRMLFRRLTVSDLSGAAGGLAMAIGGALLGWGYWALVAQQLAQAIILLAASVASAGWLPRLPHRAPMRGLLTFGGNLVATQLIAYLAQNIDSVIIGARFGAGPLGIYNRAFQLLMVPLSQLRRPTTTVALPVLSRIADDDTRWGDFLARGQVALGYTLVAGLGLVASSAEPLTAIMLGAQWMEAWPILRLLAIAGIFQTLAYVGYWAYLSRGLTAQLFRYSLVSAVLIVGCVVVGSQWGILGVAAGYAVAPLLEWPLSLWWLSRCTTIPVGRLFAGAGRIIGITTVGALAGAGSSLAAAPFGSVAQIAASVAATALSYAIAFAIVRPIRRDILAVIAVARMLPSRRTTARPSEHAAADQTKGAAQ
ncbi:lipopolysaccharide biosynthesis protein [Salinibacterium hongtaonis]|uniref:Lipopolysaccharide biosynthesis protein n=1 Tax=Homoserinimonas hongtaonis TaxID=2079791 RepID=A0A2U1T106_9MICO|nr:lipopolysaccharide biosynthesis protein [Salinibacterium hongtaonis]PWB97574.1 lipopolysaccharide biosynthesis protein [Salinibacterium hongtaonis]